MNNIPKGTRIKCPSCRRVLYEVIKDTEYLDTHSLKPINRAIRLYSEPVMCPFCFYELTDTFEQHAIYVPES